jgi:hypothetical protein
MMPTKAELTADLKDSQSELKGEKAKVVSLEARVAELEAGVPLPDSGSAATPSEEEIEETVNAALLAACAGLPCASFIRVDRGFAFERRMFQPGMAVLNPPRSLLLVGDGKWSWCDGVTFATSSRRLHRTKDGWMAWQEPS